MSRLSILPDVSDLTGALTAAAAVLTLPIGLLTGVFIGLEAAAIVFIVGWLLLVPGIPIVGEELLPALADRLGDDDEADATSPADPVAALKRQYAEGDLTEAEFERRLEALLAEDGEPTPRDGTAREAAAGDSAVAGERDRERERDA